MKFGVLGTGMVGSAVAKKLVALGHDVMAGSRSPTDAKAKELGLRVGTYAEAAAHGDGSKMATTLTLAIVTWPWVYVVQVGDSRCYRYLSGEIAQVTKDQTMAQALVDQGVLSREKVTRSPLNNVLVSAIGGDQAEPDVSRFDIRDRRSVILLCSDGLTKHVTDAELAEHLDRMTSSEQLCRELLELALSRGGSDNITILAGRAPAQ